MTTMERMSVVYIERLVRNLLDALSKWSVDRSGGRGGKGRNFSSGKDSDENFDKHVEIWNDGFRSKYMALGFM